MAKASTVRRDETLTANTVNRMSVHSHDSSGDKVDDARKHSTNKENPATANAINEEKHYTRRDQEDDVLNDGGS